MISMQKSRNPVLGLLGRATAILLFTMATSWTVILSPKSKLHSSCTTSCISVHSSCDVFHLTCRNESQAKSRLNDADILRLNVPVALSLYRSTCTSGSGTLPLLMHPRVYAVMSNKACFGDFPQSTFYSSEWKLCSEDMLQLILRHARFHFPTDSHKLNAWKVMLDILGENIKAKEILLPYNKQYNISFSPNYGPQTFEGPRMDSCPSPLDKGDVGCTISDQHTSGLYFNKELFYLLRNGYTSKNGVQFHLSGSNKSSTSCKLRFVPSHGNCGSSVEYGAKIVTSTSDVENHRCPDGSILASTWATSKSCIRDISLYLRPKIWVEKSANVPKKYLATFVGTHYKDGSRGKNGVIRDLLKLLDSPESAIIVYTHCHLAHHDIACAQLGEQERLFFSSQSPGLRFEDAMSNSTFCLCPKGRQPSTFRFMESVKSSCIPVYISDPGDDFMWQPFLPRQVPWTKGMVYFHGFIIQHLDQFLGRLSAEQVKDMLSFIDKFRTHCIADNVQIAKQFLEELAISLIQS